MTIDIPPLTLDYAPLSSILGFLALVAYVLTLLPTNLRIVFPQTKQTNIPKWLLKYRRQIGVISFILAVLHGFILVEKRDLDFLDPATYWNYIQGVSTFIVFLLLAITSNDWSMKRLKKNWKKLHSLTYLGMFLLTWHVWDKMEKHWSLLTPLSIVGMVIVIGIYAKRRWIEYSNDKQKASKKSSQKSNFPTEKVINRKVPVSKSA